MTVTSKELARKLNVSPSAVSIAMNGRPGISETTRSRILAAAAELGLTRPVRDSRPAAARYINLVIFKKHGQVVGDTPFFSELIESVTFSSARLAYHLQLSYFYSSQNHAEQIKSINSINSAGVILLATEMTEEDYPLIDQIKAPLVVLDCSFESAAIDSVVINNVQAASIAVRYLIQKGHRQIGHLASSVEISNFRERREGFLRALATSGQSGVINDIIVRVDSTSDGAYRDMTAWLSRRPKLPEAFFADNDIIAVSCIRALKEAGYNIPGDISIIGFDDMPLTRVVSPKLTTMHVPRDVMGSSAVERLSTKIAAPDGATMKIAVNAWLKEGGSVRDKAANPQILT